MLLTRTDKTTALHPITFCNWNVSVTGHKVLIDVTFPTAAIVKVKAVLVSQRHYLTRFRHSFRGTFERYNSALVPTFCALGRRSACSHYEHTANEILRL